MIRAVLFDFDDTLCDAKSAFRAGRAAAFAAILERHPELTEEALKDTWREEHRALFADLSDGRISMAGVRTERFRRLLRRLDVADDAFADEVDLLLGQVQLDHLHLLQGHEVIEELRGRGLHVGVVTNGAGDAHPESQRSKAEHLGLLARLDSFLVSDESGFRKPDARAFLPTVEAIGGPPSEILYVGDSPENDVLGANRAGLTSALLWTSEEDPPETTRMAYAAHLVRSLADVPSLVDALSAAPQGDPQAELHPT